MKKTIHILTVILFFIVTCLLVSCATKKNQKTYPKEYFIEKFTSSDAELKLQEKLLGISYNDRWNSCFDLIDEKFIEVFIPIYRECIDRDIELNSKSLPEFITAEEAQTLFSGVDSCAKERFVVRNIKKFTLEKTPESFERCLEEYEKIIPKLD